MVLSLTLQITSSILVCKMFQKVIFKIYECQYLPNSILIFIYLIIFAHKYLCLQLVFIFLLPYHWKNGTYLDKYRYEKNIIAKFEAQRRTA